MADKWLTFDCYGTVADWNTCMGGALAELAGVSGADAGRLLGAYHQAELEIEAGPGWRPYRDVLTAVGTVIRPDEQKVQAIKEKLFDIGRDIQMMTSPMTAGSISWRATPSRSRSTRSAESSASQ